MAKSSANLVNLRQDQTAKRLIEAGLHPTPVAHLAAQVRPRRRRQVRLNGANYQRLD